MFYDNSRQITFNVCHVIGPSADPENPESITVTDLPDEVLVGY